LCPPNWKIATSILFDVYSPSGVPINWNFTWVTLKTQTINYFLFAVAMFKNGL
jgi:hypothetical protein